MKNMLRSILNRLPYISKLYKQTEEFNKNSCYPAGHFYSPIASVDDIKKRQAEIWGKANTETVEGIDLNTKKQLELLKELARYYPDIPFSAKKNNSNRYFLENDMYSTADGIILYSIIRHFKPKRIIEAGSGYTSALMLDTNQLFFNNGIDLIFIDPYPQRLYSLITDADKKNATIIETNIQSVKIEVFKKLEKGDILFIDSSHVSKCGSDVNYILFEILPVLKSGVLIHFHDIYYPFEYPKSWIFNRVNWNESYFVRSFLMYNDKFEIKFFADYLHLFYKDSLTNMLHNYTNLGSSFWIEKK